MQRRTLRKRSRPEVAVDVLAPAAVSLGDGAPTSRRRKDDARKPLEVLTVNNSQSKRKAKKDSTKATKQRRRSSRVACQNLLRERAARQIQQSFRAYVDHRLRKQSVAAAGNQGIWCKLLCVESRGGLKFLNKTIGDVLMLTDLSTCLRAYTVCRTWRVVAHEVCDTRLPLRVMFQQPLCPYVRSVLSNMRQSEVEFQVSCCLPYSHDIGPTNRELFVSFLVDIQEKLLLSSVTLGLALSYVDRYMSVVPVHISKLLVLGVTSLFIASKMSEVDRVPLAIFLEVTDNTCTRSQVHEMEQSMIMNLGFKMSVPIAVTYLDFIKATLIAQLPLEDSTVIHFAQYLTELSYLQRKFLKFTPSELAVAALYVALEFLNRPVLEYIQKHFGLIKDLLQHHPSELSACMAALQSLLLNTNGSGCDALKRKFSSSQFSAVSLLFDLDPNDDYEDSMSRDYSSDEDLLDLY